MIAGPTSGLSASSARSTPSPISGGGVPPGLGAASGSTFVSAPKASSAGSVQSALDRIYGITQENTARSEQQAAELRAWQEKQNKIAMDFSAAEAAKNRDWQEMMSNTAHQREIKDLQAAGLNPILSAMGGNGAAVTSGATASGVTSSGSKGEVDTSMSQGIASLLGTLLTAQTTLESQRLSAQNNLAIAEKNNSTSELIARMYTEQSREASQLAALTGVKTSEISAAASRAMASISAAASRYGADVSHMNAVISTEAEKWVASANVAQKDRSDAKSLFSNLLRTGADFYSTLRGQNKAASSALDVAGLYTDTTKRGQDIASADTRRGQNVSTWNTIINGLFGLGQAKLRSK